jgi:hypothetical protein
MGILRPCCNSRGTGPVKTYVLTEQTLATAAVEAVAAQLRVVCRDAVADLEGSDLGADGGHDADGLMAGDKGELGNELSLVDVLGGIC